jgi:hypothetical protein
MYLDCMIRTKPLHWMISGGVGHSHPYWHIQIGTSKLAHLEQGLVTSSYFIDSIKNLRFGTSIQRNAQCPTLLSAGIRFTHLLKIVALRASA